MEFTRQGVARGARTARPLVIGTFPFGLVVGIASTGKGLSLVEGVLMSVLVFAGSAQLVVLELWSDPAPVLAAGFTALVVNLRMAPMGAALAPWLDGLRGWRLWGSLALLVDYVYALAAADQRRGGRDAGFLLGVGLVLWGAWIVAVAAGQVLAGAVALAPGHPLFFAAPAAFVALLVPLWRGVRQDAGPWVLAAVVALLVQGAAGLGPPWPLLAGALAGAALGAWQEGRGKAAPPEEGAGAG